MSLRQKNLTMFGFLPTALLVLLQAYTSNAKSVVYETAPSHLPSGWRHLGPADDTRRLSLSIALKQPGLQELRVRLDDISNPSHKAYGAHLSRDAVLRYREVSETAVDSVFFWLQESNVTDFALEDAWVRLNATVAQVNALLGCSMSSYRMAGVSDVLYRAHQYSLPEELLDSVDYVYPVTQFMTKRNLRRSSKSSSAGKKSIKRDSIVPRAGMLENKSLVAQESEII